ncbi:EF-hand domain-containing protein [Pseudomonadota bacterium]
MKSPDQAVFKVILIASMIIAIAVLPVVAKADHHKPSGPPTFGDGFVSEEEFTAFRAARMAAMAEAGKPMKGAATAPAFSDIDTDGDGMLNEAELTAAQQAHHKAMREQYGKGKGEGKGMHHGHGQGKGMPTFADLDLDGDGCINAEEFAKHQAERHGKVQTPDE